MTTQESPSEKSNGDGDVRLELRSLRKMMTVVLFMCMGVSVCFNAYVVRENLVLKERAAELDKRLVGFSDMHQFMQRLVRDLKYLGRSDKALADLLAKYRLGFEMLGVDSQVRGAPPQ